MPGGSLQEEFLSRDFTHLKIELLTGSVTKSGEKHKKSFATLWYGFVVIFVSASAAETMYSE